MHLAGTSDRVGILCISDFRLTHVSIGYPQPYKNSIGINGLHEPALSLAAVLMIPRWIEGPRQSLQYARRQHCISGALATFACHFNVYDLVSYKVRFI